MKNRGNTWENIEILRFYVLVMYNTEIIFIVFQKKIEKFFDSGTEVETASRILGVPKSKRSVEF